MSVLDWLGKLTEKNQRDTAALLQIATANQWNQELIRSKHRAEAQVDALQKCRHGENYKPPEVDDSMGHTFINSPIISDAAARELGIALSQQQSQSQDELPTRRRRKRPSMLGAILKTLIPLLIATAAGYAAAKYFAPSVPPPVQYDIEALPYQP